MLPALLVALTLLGCSCVDDELAMAWFDENSEGLILAEARADSRDTVHPCGVEIPGNGIDDDCDGDTDET